MLERLTEQFLEDETLTAGLSEEDASELVGWLLGIAEDLEEQTSAGEGGFEHYLAQLKRLGAQVARLSRRYKIPVEELVDLIELAWEEPGEPGGSRPMQA
ncbi:hypothetical protein [Meiothermus granaticius]|uniref:Uncharacterized protein n=1 Tax=Meiothermus granaticius NBRC 107808 TaxID=1227551 RepID=A0A399F881_9DEIN|nr:hypothetical protein [Meiothermus granaticius]MCL6526876.1 hypothetical protein [Thermaceae bacterium]RIH91876.1 hypothetical protein Mgrana_02237 [Meiothermus granaticius NBRC 107808]GEM87543.1 hypothetical protein MGR01S_21680 [Meiothermus granaticius NBRC 107808]